MNTGNNCCMCQKVCTHSGQHSYCALHEPKGSGAFLIKPLPVASYGYPDEVLKKEAYQEDLLRSILVLVNEVKLDVERLREEISQLRRENNI